MNAEDTYRAALAASDAAFHVYDPIRSAYQGGKVSDADYLAARVTYYATMDTFDAAWHTAAAANVFMDREA